MDVLEGHTHENKLWLKTHAKTNEISKSGMILKRFIIGVLIFLTFSCTKALENNSKFCAIASAHPLATQAGCEILENGGNAFDAAVAVTSVLAVVEPFSSGIGGGGFYLLHREEDNFQVFIDAREKAPLNSDPQFFVNPDGKAKNQLSLNGPTSAAIPGIPAALDWLATNYGNLNLTKTLKTAIEIAESGFNVDARYSRAVKNRQRIMNSFSDTSTIFLDNYNTAKPSFILQQKNLSRTLSLIAQSGRDGFYEGPVANELVRSVNSSGGFWTKIDLESYQVVEREPIYLTFKDAKITSAPLPSSGGLVIAQVLNILENYPLDMLNNYDGQHILIEAMRRGYNDRAIHMGDQDFVNVPVSKLLSSSYAKERSANINLSKATKSRTMPSVTSISEEGTETTHFSIIDKYGNRVAATLSINTTFGSGFVAGNTGVLLNNHMNDFVLTPNSPNIYGLVGNTKNSIEPGKRPLSSMSPTFVEDDRGVLVIGTPGGSRIISMVILGILEYLKEPKPNLQNIVSKPRLHHQYLPDHIFVEPEGFSEKWIQTMETKGHKVVRVKKKWGNMQAVLFNKSTKNKEIANDPRELK